LTTFSIDSHRPFGGAGRPFNMRGAELKRPLVVTARDPVAEDDLPQGLANVAVAEIELSDLSDFDRLARRWQADSSEKSTKPSLRDVDGTPLTPREREQFIEGMLREHGWETVVARPHGDDDSRFLVAAATDHLADLEGNWDLSILFGAKTIQMPVSTPAEVVVTVEVSIADNFVGLIGMLIFLAAFSGAVPDLLQKGSLDLVLARPVGRARVLLCTYAGSVLTVLLVSAAIFAACALALGVRSGFYSLAFVGCALPAAAVFAMLQPVAMLFGLLTRNSTLAMLASVGFWGLAKAIATIRILLVNEGVEAATWKRLVDGLYWIAPKTSEMALLDLTMVGKMQLSPAAFERLLQVLPQEVAKPDWWFIGGSSALFAAIVLALTILIFRRRDV
jgi:ABC-type transport system involved in multi-copper enzyme maturation permease subunit